MDARIIMNSSISYALIMLLAGLGIPVMAALNGGLGGRLQSPALAATILFGVGLAVAVVVLLITEGMPSKLTSDPPAPWYFYCGGAFVIFYVLSITWVAPRFGVSNAISFVLLGQLLAMTVIDHFALIGAPHFPVNSQRLLGLALMTAGIFMVVNRYQST